MFVRSKQKETQTLPSSKIEPLGHFLNISSLGSVMKIQTERNLKSFQIRNLVVKTASKQANLLVKGAKTPTDTENTRF